MNSDRASPVFSRTRSPGIPCPVQAITPEREPGLDIEVIFTSVEGTLVALTRAGKLAENLGARIVLVVPQIVPWPLPLESPPVLLEFQEARFREIASSSPVDIHVHLYLCREPLNILGQVLKPRSLTVVAGRKGFWPTKEQRLTRTLKGMGHEVIFVET